MSKLDLEEQEQIEQIRVFWSRWGHLILGILIVILGSYLAWVQWQNHQNSQAIKASAMFDELEKVSLGPDLVKMTEVFSDLKTHYPKTIYAQQAGLIIAKYQFEAKQLDEAVVSLTWVSNNASLDEFRSIAHLRLAGVLFEQKKYDEALQLLGKPAPEAFTGLLADRRGDVLLAQEKHPEAIEAYTQAWKALEAHSGYRRLVETKLGTLGVSLGETGSVLSSAPGSAQ
jgi:predicted negative regulator of RcsB-dependent stress response